MADNRSVLIAALKAAFEDAPGTDDDFQQIAEDIADAVRAYALALVADPGGSNYTLG